MGSQSAAKTGIRTSCSPSNRKSRNAVDESDHAHASSPDPPSCEPFRYPGVVAHQRPSTGPRSIPSVPASKLTAGGSRGMASPQSLLPGSLCSKEYQGRSCLARGAEWEMMSARLATGFAFPTLKASLPPSTMTPGSGGLYSVSHRVHR